MIAGLAGCAAPGASPGSSAGPMVVQVVARQYEWSFRYPDGRVSPVFHAPAGRPVELRITSEDVVHAFYVEGMKLRVDAVPGRESRAEFLAARPGTMNVACAEFCGAGNFRHKTQAVVQDEEEFGRWLSGTSDR